MATLHAECNSYRLLRIAENADIPVGDVEDVSKVACMVQVEDKHKDSLINELYSHGVYTDEE